MQVLEVIKGLHADAPEETVINRPLPREIVRGVYLLRMPMPFRLDHINLYLLDDPEGWTLVDCGLNNDESKAVWDSVFADFIGDKPVIRLIVTHLHPDHIGLASWLQEKSRAPIYMTRPEWGLAQALFDLPRSDPAGISRHYERLGLGGERLEQTVKQASGYARMVKALPRQVQFLSQDELLHIGGRRWRVLFGHGHSPACACLWDESERVLIAGDHILPDISPNINLLAVGPSDPLQDYLTSLNVFRALPGEMVLPAHGLPTPRLRERIDELLAHHARHLDDLRAACHQPLTACDCVPLMFKPDLPDHQYYFAIGESAAHLVYLAGQGRLSRAGDVPWRFIRS